MKKVLPLFLIVSFFSCEPSKITVKENSEISDVTNPYGLVDTLLINGEYLIFLNEKKYPPLIKTEAFATEEDSVKLIAIEQERYATIQELADSYGLTVAADGFFMNAFSGFFVRETTRDQILRMLSDTVDIGEIHQNFIMQNTRAQMQSDSALMQNTRAQMQQNPEWGYDATLFTSKAVTYLGGGAPISATKRKIWIIDSGIDVSHQDLEGLVIKNLSRSFVEGGLNPGNDKNPFFDFWGHGTACAGLAAARPANISNPNIELIGMTGVSPGARLVSLKVFGEDRDSQYHRIVEAIDYASGRRRMDKGDVLSLSLGGLVDSCGDFGLKEKIEQIASIKQVFFALAASNASEVGAQHSTQYLPACVDGAGIFTVGSIDLDYLSEAVGYSAFSNFGTPPIDYLTPGNFIFTTYPGNSYAVMQGTSMSTALMAGLLHLTNGEFREKATVPGIHGETDLYRVPMK